jgi:hypothetical protein
MVRPEADADLAAGLAKEASRENILLYVDCCCKFYREDNRLFGESSLARLGLPEMVYMKAMS